MYAIRSYYVSGDRSGLEQPTVERIRAASLAHTLALSGLHSYNFV